MKDIEGIAFDLDGTLYPNYQFNTLLIPFMIKEFRLLSAFGKARTIIRKEQEKQDYTPKPGRAFYKYQSEITAKLLKAKTQIIHDKIDTLMYKGWEPLFKKVKLYKRSINTLAAFKEAGFKLGLMSDFPPETKLEYLGLTKFPSSQTPIWDAVLCSEHCGALKPHSLPFLELASAMSLPPEKILYVGNSRAYDVAGANNAGMKTAWVKNPLFPGKGFKHPKADFVFTNYRQLYDFMLK